MTISLGAGERGTGWDWATEGMLGQRGKQAIYQGLEPAEELKNHRWREWGPLYKSADQRDGQATTPDSPPILEDAGQLYEPFASAKESGIPPLVYDMDQSAQIGEIETNLGNHFKQSLANFGTGKKDASKDADWEEYISTAKAIGVETYVQIKQAAYDNRVV
ncbi:hypothetical protein [Brachybacterium hainanense]|uniref:Uncharacterized protein n=1 Tax=Brachybacterium hainanense TaxID=1541174 RepID=A0ABV6RJ42_9MICO